MSNHLKRKSMYRSKNLVFLHTQHVIQIWILFCLFNSRQCVSFAHCALSVAWGAAGVGEGIWRCGHRDPGAWDTSSTTHGPLMSHEQSGEKPPCLGPAAALCSHYTAYVLEHG